MMWLGSDKVLSFWCRLGLSRVLTNTVKESQIWHRPKQTVNSVLICSDQIWSCKHDSDRLLLSSSLSRRSLHIYEVKRETQSWATTFNWTLMHNTILSTASGSVSRRWRSCWRSSSCSRDERSPSNWSFIRLSLRSFLFLRIQSVWTSQASVDLRHDLLLVISSPVKTKLREVTVTPTVSPFLLFIMLYELNVSVFKSRSADPIGSDRTSRFSSEATAEWTLLSSLLGGLSSSSGAI